MKGDDDDESRARELMRLKLTKCDDGGDKSNKVIMALESRGVNSQRSAMISFMPMAFPACAFVSIRAHADEQLRVVIDVHREPERRN